MVKAAHLRIHGRDWLSVTTLVVLVIWFCDGIIFDGKVPFFRDLGTYTFPLKYSLAKSFQNGDLPLWDRHIATGFPVLAALQPGAFYPPNIVYWMLPFYDALRATFLLHYLLAAVGAYFLCRWWQLPMHVSIIASTLFTIGGTTVSLSNLLNHFQTGVWLPWLVLCWERMLRSRTWCSFLILSLVLLCALLAGSPEIYLLSLFLLICDGARIRRENRIITMTRVIVLLLASNVLVAALGMAQFLPTYELMSLSRRDQPIPLQEATAWSLAPSSLGGLFFPDKEVDTSLSIGVRLLFANEIPLLLTHYLGVSALIGLCLWYYFASWKTRVFTVCLIFASLILAFGKFTPVYGYLFDLLPVIRALRFPEKLFFFTYACLVFLVLRGYGASHRGGESQDKVPLIIVACILTLWVGLYGALRAHPPLLALVASWDAVDVANEMSFTTKAHATVLFHLERQIAITLALMLIFACRWKRVLRPALCQLGLVVITILDLGSAHKPYQFLLDPGLVTTSPLISPSFQAEGHRLFYYPPGGNLHPSFVSVLGRPQFAKATAINAENLLPNTGVLYGLDYFQEIDALARQSYNDFLNFANLASPERRVKLLRALNVRYVASFRELSIVGLTLYRHMPEQYSWFYEVKDPAPRTYVVSDAMHETQPAKILRILSSAEFDPSKQVIVDQDVPQRARTQPVSSAKIVDYGNTSVTIEASTSAPGMLILADAYYPGWKAFVDEREKQIMRANNFFRAVELPAGTHKVRFEYAPWSFTWGSRISLITASVVVLVTIAPWIWNLIALRSRFVLART